MEGSKGSNRSFRRNKFRKDPDSRKNTSPARNNEEVKSEYHTPLQNTQHIGAQSSRYHQTNKRFTPQKPMDSTMLSCVGSTPEQHAFDSGVKSFPTKGKLIDSSEVTTHNPSTRETSMQRRDQNKQNETPSRLPNLHIARGSNNRRPAAALYTVPHLRQRSQQQGEGIASPASRSAHRPKQSQLSFKPTSIQSTPPPTKPQFDQGQLTVSEGIEVTPPQTLHHSSPPEVSTKEVVEPVGASSDGPDEVILQPESKVKNRRPSSKTLDSARGSSKQTVDKMPHHVSGIFRQWYQDNNTTTSPGDVEQEAMESNNENAFTGDGMSQRQMPGSVKGEALDELNRLRAEIVQNAHLNRFKNLDYPTANPDILKKCREGPGTDPNSVFYLSITKCRLSPMQALSEYPGTSMTPGGLGPLEPGEAEAHGRTVPWLMYERSPGAYPIIKDGSLCLSSEPTEDHRRIQAQLGGSGLQMGDGGKTPESKEDATHSWTDTFYADWEYRPRACSSLEAFRDWFRRWLDTTLQICCYADIYHQAFFDGTAHADGVRSMFIPDLDDGSTFLDTEDKESLLHQHETVEGYCHNWAIHTRREEAQEASRRKLQREGYLQGLRDAPQAPRSVLKENVYLRPVEVGDVPGLLEIFNHYAMASPLSAYFQDIEAGDIRQLIDDCNFERLPFIVAAERKIAQAQDNSPEKIYGYVLATDFVGRRTTARFTAELELFVKPGHTRKGIGKCLMDKLLEVCDPTYLPKRGYFFDTNQEDRPGYGPGGRRRLGRLLFAISYPADERTTYAWVEDWLKESYDFEEQGRLQGARVKFETFLNVTYLVRNIGYYSNNKFKP